MRVRSPVFGESPTSWRPRRRRWRRAAVSWQPRVARAELTDVASRARDRL